MALKLLEIAHWCVFINPAWNWSRFHWKWLDLNGHGLSVSDWTIKSYFKIYLWGFPTLETYSSMVDPCFGVDQMHYCKYSFVLQIWLLIWIGISYCVFYRSNSKNNLSWYLQSERLVSYSKADRNLIKNWIHSKRQIWLMWLNKRKPTRLKLWVQPGEAAMTEPRNSEAALTIWIIFFTA